MNNKRLLCFGLCAMIDLSPVPSADEQDVTSGVPAVVFNTDDSSGSAIDEEIPVAPCEGDQAVVFNGDISSGGPFRKLILRRERSNSWFQIELRDPADVIMQTLSIRNGVPVGETDVELVDLNADGFKDIKLRGGTDWSGTNWYKTWLWDSERDKYVWINDRDSTN